jgi:hypothetical protein
MGGISAGIGGATGSGGGGWAIILPFLRLRIVNSPAALWFWLAELLRLTLSRIAGRLWGWRSAPRKPRSAGNPRNFQALFFDGVREPQIAISVSRREPS